MSVAPWDDEKRVWLNLYSVAIGAMCNQITVDRDLTNEAVRVADVGLAAYRERWPKEQVGNDD